MTHGITRFVLGRKVVTPIDARDFDSIREATESLISLLLIESDYDILLSNYVDLEKTMLSLAVESFLRVSMERALVERDHRNVNRMIANLLSSARAFIDRTEHYVSSVLGSDKSDVHRLFSCEYDSFLSYRVMEELRDHTQHRGVPTQSIEYQLRWTDPKEVAEAKLLTQVSPSLLVEHLRSDPKFKKAVLDELEASHGKRVPLMPLIREYVGSLSSVNFQVRQLYAPKKEVWYGTLEKWAAGCPEAFEGAVGAVAAAFDEKGHVTEEIHLDLQLRERLGSLECANGRLANLQKMQAIS